jgi:hypothetical protein
MIIYKNYKLSCFTTRYHIFFKEKLPGVSPDSHQKWTMEKNIAPHILRFMVGGGGVTHTRVRLATLTSGPILIQNYPILSYIPVFTHN